MSPLFAISNRRPFAPAALPTFAATIGASDFLPPLLPSSLFGLVGECALFRAGEKDLLGYCPFLLSPFHGYLNLAVVKCR